MILQCCTIFGIPTAIQHRYRYVVYLKYVWTLPPRTQNTRIRYRLEPNHAEIKTLACTRYQPCKNCARRKWEGSIFCVHNSMFQTKTYKQSILHYTTIFFLLFWCKISSGVYTGWEPQCLHILIDVFWQYQTLSDFLRVGCHSYPQTSNTSPL